MFLSDRYWGRIVGVFFCAMSGYMGRLAIITTISVGTFVWSDVGVMRVVSSGISVSH